MVAKTKMGVNKMFRLLSHPHRRHILYHLTQEPGTIDIDTLSALLVNQDDGHPGQSRNTSSDTIKVELHHMHLPKLVNSGIITFDADTGLIELIETEGYGQFLAEAARVDGYTRPVADQ